MGFKKSNNLNKLETSIEEKNKTLHIKEEVAKESTRTTREEEVVQSIDTDLSLETEIISKLLTLKHESKDNAKKKNEQISVRLSAETFSKIKELTSSGILSQSELITILIEKLYKDLKGGK